MYHWVPWTIFSIAPFTIGPLHTIDSSGLTRNPIDMHLIPKFETGNIMVLFSSLTCKLNQWSNELACSDESIRMRLMVVITWQLSENYLHLSEKFLNHSMRHNFFYQSTSVGTSPTVHYVHLKAFIKLWTFREVQKLYCG